MNKQSKFLLTDSVIPTIPPPISGHSEIIDTVQKHLYLKVTSTGARYWYCAIRFDSHLHRLKIGAWPAMIADKARQAITEMLAAADDGISPRKFRDQKQNRVVTYAHAFTQYLNGHLRVFAKPSTAADAESGFLRFFDSFKNMSVAEITSLAVQKWVNELALLIGKPTASKQFHLFKACIKWCENHGIISLRKNPCDGVRDFATNYRHRYLRPGDEFRRFKDAMDEHAKHNLDAIDLIWMLLWTGQRKGNTRAMRWDEIDLETGIWQIPMTKSGKPHVVALSRAALAILHRRKASTAWSAWVFPSVGKSGHIININRPLDKVCTTAGIDDFHVHDLRHTYGSWLGLSGASAFTIQSGLGHSTSRMTEKYTHLNVDHVREALEKVQSNFSSKFDNSNNVVQFNKMAKTSLTKVDH